jgi:beta-phosphoglucomutase-like phosphatase (HAD superfamily)
MILALSLLAAGQLQMDRLSVAPNLRAVFPALAPAPRTRTALPLPEVLLCDLDGTLVDTMPILSDVAAEVLAEVYGLPRSLGRELYLETCGLPFTQQLDAICPGDPRNPTASALFETRKRARCRSARMPADTYRALASLQTRGVAIVVSSNNGVENVKAFASASDFPFDLVLSFGDGLAKGRPHVERATSAFGAPASAMMFVGDSLHDGEIAEREGLRFVGVAGTFSKERFALRFPGRPVLRRLAEINLLFE